MLRSDMYQVGECTYRPKTQKGCDICVWSPIVISLLSYQNNSYCVLTMCSDPF